MGATIPLVFIAALAGAFSVLTPCVLVMLPALLAVSGGAGRRRVFGVLVGLEASFIGISLLAAAALDSLGLPATVQQDAAVVIIAALGVTMLVPRLRSALELLTSRLVNRVPGTAAMSGGGDGLIGGFVGGLGLGLVWSPCAGPVLAAITAGSVADGFGQRTIAMALAFGAGMLGPLLAVLIGGQRVVTRIRGRLGTRRLDRILGVGMLATAALLATGAVTDINRVIAERVDLTSTPIAGLESTVLDGVANDDLAAAGSSRARGADGTPARAVLERVGYPSSDGTALDDLGPAPSLTGVHRTYNLPEGTRLDDEFLRGKVVVYDFWTYSCINCIRTLPYVHRLADTYAKDGLVVVGVHTPEFAFEQDESNVRDAIDDLDVTWPVATDPDSTTWNAFHNRYWPAKYVTDRTGELRWVHYGEGDYDHLEHVVRELLGLDPGTGTMPAEPIRAADQTPETYLGLDRVASQQWRSRVAGTDLRVADGMARYAIDQGSADSLERDQFALVGNWRVEGERAVAGVGASILLHYHARAVYLVFDPGDHGSARRPVIVHDGSEPLRRVSLDTERLYTLRAGDSIADSLLRIEVPSGVAAHAFTFG